MTAKHAKRRVVVTGYGMVTPLGPNAEICFRNCRQGLSGIDRISTFDTRGLTCQIGGQVDDRWLSDPKRQPMRTWRKLMSRELALMYTASREAARQANLAGLADRERIGVAMGSFGESLVAADIARLHRYHHRQAGWDMSALLQAGGHSFLRLLRRKPDMTAAILARMFDCRGSNLASASACSAGAQAIGEGYRLIQADSADVMLAGGCEAPLTFATFIGFILLRAVAERYETPQTASRPFDRKRNGFVLSEGAAVLVLEEREHARRRKAPILGELLGYGASADAYRITDCDPRGAGAALAMQTAMLDAGVTPGQIDYINAHGTSTLKNDVAETRAVKTLFGSLAPKIPISSNKSMLGHTIAASGAIEAVLSLMGMQRSVILPTINHRFPDPKCDLGYVPNEALTKEQHVVLSNSFGFGGQNACLCLGRAA